MKTYVVYYTFRDRERMTEIAAANVQQVVEEFIRTFSPVTNIIAIIAQERTL